MVFERIAGVIDIPRSGSPTDSVNASSRAEDHDPYVVPLRVAFYGVPYPIMRDVNFGTLACDHPLQPTSEERDRRREKKRAV